MATDLSGINRRVDRAERDLDSLRDAVAAYLEPAPFHTVIERNGSSEGVRTYIDRQPDPEWAIDFGSISVLARSALDHLIFQLVIDSDNPASKNTRTQFPIFEREENYREHRERMLKGVARRHRKLIDRLQPYHLGKRASEDPLAILATIANREKHREDHVALGAVGQATFRIDRSLIQPPVDDLEIAIDRGPDRPILITDGGLLFGIENVPSPDAPNERVRLEPGSLEPVLLFEGDRLVSLDDLTRSIAQVSAIVRRFANRIRH